MAERPPEEGVNVQVLLRCRPLSDKEKVERAPQVIVCNEVNREVTLFSNNGGKSGSRTFRFDKVFGCDSTQEKLFKQAIVPIVNEVMDGFNCTIFAYGQTGTGKTYTMEGGPRESDDGRKLSAEAGVIPRSIKQIFETIEMQNIDSTVKVSFLELYNEELTDLMSITDDDAKKLRLLEDRSGVVVQGLEEVIVRSAAEIYQVLDRGTAKRKTASTLLNQRSSRSHSIFAITIHMKETTPEGEDVIKIGKLNLVDLAGSENISRSGAKDGRAREAGSINQSLLTLGRVITALVEHSGHVPYRDSKLTRLLRDSLGGRTKTCIIATIAPTVQCQDETISTLDYAHRAKNIRNRPELNQKISKTTMIKELAAEIEKLKIDLQCTRDKNGVYLSSESYEKGELDRVRLSESNKVMKQELEQAQQILEAKEQQLAATQEELERMTTAVQERMFVGASLRRAENSLAGFAEQLINELSLYSQDVQMLMTRMQQSSSLHASDRKCLSQIQEHLNNRLSLLKSSLGSALAGQSAHLAAIAEDVSSFKTQKEKDVSVLKQQLASIQAGVDALRGAAIEQMQAIKNGSQTTLQHAGTKVEALASSALASATEAAAHAEAALAGLVEAMQAQGKSLQDMAKLHAQEASASQAMLAQYQQTVHASLAGTITAADTAKSAEQGRLQQVQDVLSGFVTSFNKSMQQQQVDLMSQVQAMLEAATAERTAQLAEGMSALQERLTSNSRAAVDGSMALQASAKEALEQLQGMGSALGTKLSATDTSLQTSAQTAANSAEAACKAGTASAHQQRQHGKQIQAAITAEQQAVCAMLSTGSQQCAAAVQQSTESLAAASSTLASMQQHVAQAVESQHDESMVFVGALSRQAEDAMQALQGFGQSQATSLDQLGSEVSERVQQTLSVGVPTPPDMRVRPQLPSIGDIHSLMCPGEEVLLTQLRNTQREIQKRGGDVRQAAAMLLTPARARRTSPRDAAMSIERPHSPGADDGIENATAPLSPQNVQAARSKIPGFSSKHDVTPVRRSGGLADRTNL